MDVPEIRMARRLSEIMALTPPVDVFAVAREMADLHVIEIPRSLGVDGVTIDLKIPKRRPKIVVRKHQNERRMRFTAAHEVGHVVIPWHTGTIIDQTVEVHDHDSYWQMEAEANRFASELLMPTSWVLHVIAQQAAVIDAVEAVAEKANVYRHASLLKVVPLAPPGILFAIVDGDGAVVYSGKSPKTLATRPRRGARIDLETHFTSATATTEYPTHGDKRLILWEFGAGPIKCEADDPRKWQQVLDNIISELGISADAAAALRRSICAKAAYANSEMRSDRSAEAITSAITQRLESTIDHAYMREFIAHPDCMIFIKKRAATFSSK